MATTALTRKTEMAQVGMRARWATVRVETDGGIYVGRLYVPDTKKRVSDVLADDRQFLSLTEVSVNDQEQIESFVAVNKQFVRTLRIIDEGTAPLVRVPRSLPLDVDASLWDWSDDDFDIRVVSPSNSGA